MYETKIQTKIFEAQRIIDGFLQILRENNDSSLNICKEKELTDSGNKLYKTRKTLYYKLCRT